MLKVHGKSSNRTIVGLKPLSMRNKVVHYRRSNRTIVGLKPFKFVVMTSTNFAQQSHHCGIETRTSLSSASHGRSSSNRTIVGLKRWTWDFGPTCVGSQQSHHCGIETWQRQFKSQTCHLQQSHHCGIETIFMRTERGRLLTAAIAPLWD